MAGAEHFFEWVMFLLTAGTLSALSMLGIRVSFTHVGSRIQPIIVGLVESAMILGIMGLLLLIGMANELQRVFDVAMFSS